MEEDPYNEDAQLGLSKVEPAREDISLAKALVRGKDYKGAIELITKIIEVSNKKINEATLRKPVICMSMHFTHFT